MTTAILDEKIRERPRGVPQVAWDAILAITPPDRLPMVAGVFAGITPSNTPTLDETPQEDWLPTWCPSWCNGEHAQYLAENPGDWEGARDHFAAGPDRGLDRIANYVDGRVYRSGGDHYSLGLVMTPVSPKINGADLVRLRLEQEDCLSEGPRKAVEVRFSSGEARVLAAQLLAMAERLDI